MAVKGMGNITITYNSNALTSYCNQADMQATADSLDTTTFGSTAKESIAGTTDWKISLSGLWTSALDAFLAPDVITPGTKRTVVMTLTAGSTVTYTWTANGEIGDMTWSSTPTGLTTWKAELRLSGAPVRS